MTEADSTPGRSYTLSARAKHMGSDGNVPIMDYLRAGFSHLPFKQIDSVFGFVERSTLYGGRPFTAPELTPQDVEALYEHGIGLRLPLTNHQVTREEYDSAWDFLAKYYRAGNSVIVTNDDLAGWIRVSTNAGKWIRFARSKFPLWAWRRH